MVRRFIPKGNSILIIPKEEITKIETWLNNYPRRILGGKSANQKESEIKKEKNSFAV